MPITTINGTRKLMTLVKTKFCTPGTPSADSAGSKFHLIESILLCIARSNLLATATEKTFFQSLLNVCWSPLSVTVHKIVLFHKTWVKMLLSCIGNQILVHGLITSVQISGELYTLIFCSSRVQLTNQGPADVLISVVPLFLNTILIIGLDHWAIASHPPGNQVNPDNISISRPLYSGLHCEHVWLA